MNKEICQDCGANIVRIGSDIMPWCLGCKTHISDSRIVYKKIEQEESSESFKDVYITTLAERLFENLWPLMRAKQMIPETEHLIRDCLETSELFLKRARQYILDKGEK